MTWFLNAGNETEAGKPHNLLVIAIDADFPSGHLRLSTWVAPLQINGQTFTGAGNLGKVAVNTETTQLTAQTRTYQLSGVDPAIVPESEIDNCFGRSFTEYLVWLDVETQTVIGFEINFEGRMDQVNRRDGATPFVEVNVEHRLVTLDRADNWCYTTEHQGQFFSGDTGFDQVKELQSVQVTWGGGPVVPGSPPGPHTYPRIPGVGFGR